MLALLITATVIIAVTALWLQQRKYESKLQFPGPKTWPLLGNLTYLTGNKSKIVLVLKDLIDKFPGGLMKFYFGPTHGVVYITNVDCARHFLTSTTDLRKSALYGMVAETVGDGLITSSPSKYKIHRRMLEPAFSMKALNGFVDLFNRKATILIAQIAKAQQEVGDKAVEVTKLLHLYSLDNICEAATGLDMSAQTKPLPYSNAINIMLAVVVLRYFDLFLRFDPIFKRSSIYQQYQQSKKITQQIIREIVKESRTRRKTCGVRNKSFIDLLIDAEYEKKFSDKEIDDHVNTFLFAGHETISKTLAFALYEIARHPSIQDDLFKEVDDLVQAEHCVSLEEMHQMKLVDMVMKETLRLYPPVPVIERLVEQDVEIGGARFPKDTTIALFIYAIQRDAKNFPNPDEFRPLRFGDSEELVPGSYIPFSRGPRNCIGQRYATLVFRLTIASILREYRLELPEGFHLDLGTEGTMTSLNGFPLKFIPRKNNK